MMWKGQVQAITSPQNDLLCVLDVTIKMNVYKATSQREQFSHSECRCCREPRPGPIPRLQSGFYLLLGPRERCLVGKPGGRFWGMQRPLPRRLFWGGEALRRGPVGHSEKRQGASNGSMTPSCSGHIHGNK